MTFFGLKWGQDLENLAAHPHQEFLEVPPSRGFCRSFYRTLRPEKSRDLRTIDFNGSFKCAKHYYFYGNLQCYLPPTAVFNANLTKDMP